MSKFSGAAPSIPLFAKMLLYLKLLKHVLSFIGINTFIVSVLVGTISVETFFPQFFMYKEVLQMDAKYM